MTTETKTSSSTPLHKLVSVLQAVEDAFIVFVLLGMILLAVLQIISRNFVGSSFPWIDPLLQNAVLWIAMLGAMIASRNDSHIRIDLISEYVPQRYQRWIVLLVDLVTVAVTAGMAYFSFHSVMEERMFGSDGIAGIPDWVLQLLLPVGFGVIALRYTGLSLLGLLNKRPKQSSTEVIT